MTSNRRRDSKVASMSLEGLNITQTPGEMGDNEGSKGIQNGSQSVPGTPVSNVAMDFERNGMENLESDNDNSVIMRLSSDPGVIPPSTKVTLSTTCSVPLAVIEEPEEVGGGEGDGGRRQEEGNTRDKRRRRLCRSPSPALNVPPSPIRGPSPSNSPCTIRKSRVARRKSRCEFKCPGH